MVDWTSALTKMRKEVHAAFRVPVQYESPNAIGVFVDLFARWHDRAALQGNLVDTGYADVLVGVDRLIFSREELDQKGVVLLRGGRIQFGPLYQNIVLILDAREQFEGPINVTWKVVRP